MKLQVMYMDSATEIFEVLDWELAGRVLILYFPDHTTIYIPLTALKWYGRLSVTS